MIKITALNEVSTGKDEEEDVTTITKEAQVKLYANYFPSEHNLKHYCLLLTKKYPAFLRKSAYLIFNNNFHSNQHFSFK